MGKYLNDRKHGFGIYTWQDGRQYLWQQHGDAIYRNSTELNAAAVGRIASKCIGMMK